MRGRRKILWNSLDEDGVDIWNVEWRNDAKTNNGSLNGRSKEKRKTSVKMDWLRSRGFEGHGNKKLAWGGQRRKEEDFVRSEGPQWDVVLEKRKKSNFVQEQYGVTTNSTKFLNMGPRYLRWSLNVIGLSKLRPTNKERKSPLFSTLTARCLGLPVLCLSELCWTRRQHVPLKRQRTCWFLFK